MNIGLGTASFGTTIPEEAAHDILDTYASWGGVIVDTANNYAFWAGCGGESEAVIGNWLKLQERDGFEIHTKIGAQPTDGINFDTAEGLSHKAIFDAVEASLNRLSTTYLDVLYAHIDDTSTPLMETWSAFNELVKKGVVRKLGISNYSLNRINELAQVIEKDKLVPIHYAQYRHSVIEPKKSADFGVQVCFNKEIIQALKTINTQIKLVAYSPLLDGGFEAGYNLPEPYDTESNRRSVQQVQSEARTLGVSPSALVLKKISESGVIPLTMTGKVARLTGNMELFRK